MTTYCLGFAFATAASGRLYVALIRKTKPEWQAGKLNGIGGKVEGDEMPRQAMVREFREETGGDTDPAGWVYFAALRFPTATVCCFCGKMEWDKFESLRTTTPEEVVLIALDEIGKQKAMPNLSWLIPMARAYLNDQTMNRILIEDTNIPAIFE